ncbi:MAG: FAD-dependent oxidoreductase [Conexivisphaerales archaeon]
MSTEYDVIVVGAGPAGSASALTLARKGANVLMLEKARIPGERNVTGGVLYGSYISGYGMLDLLPNFETEAPVERKIVSHSVYMLSRPDKDLSYRYYRLTDNSLPSRLGFFSTKIGTGHDYSVLKRRFDHWLALKAVEAGAMLSTDTTAEDLIVEDGKVKGVRTNREEITAKVVIDCSGVTSKLIEKASLRSRLKPEQLYHGIKHVYSLNPELIEKRFSIGKGEGIANFYLGDFMHGLKGGAFLYTNRDTLSIGLVVGLDSLVEATSERFYEVGKLLDVLNEFESHPMIAEILDGAELLEYSAHNIPRGYSCMVDKPYTDGFLVAGDALGSFVKIGPLIDGMRRAIASGIMAAETYLSASQKGVFSSATLAEYRERLSPLYGDVMRSARDSRVTESRLVYRYIPRFLFRTGFLTKQAKPDSDVASLVAKRRANGDAIQLIQQRTGLLEYDEDRIRSHIQVNIEKGSESPAKPWVPACPVNCYTLFTQKGVFASFRDLYLHNLKLLNQKEPEQGFSREAMELSLKDIREGRLRFDHVACVACGTCGAIGPPEIVTFDHEWDGHGVRYKYG